MKIIIPRMETTYFHGAYDGGCKYMQQLGEDLIKRGHEVEIVTTKLREKPFMEESIYRGVKHTFISPEYTGKRFIPFNMWYKLKFSWNLNNYLKNKDFDVLHNSEIFAYWYLHNKLRKPVIFQSWALEPFYGKECLSQKGIRRLYVQLFLRKPWLYCLKKADGVTLDMEAQIPLLLNLGVKKEKIIFIPNGIPWEEIRKKRGKFKDKRKSLQFNKKDFVILSVGQIVESKGVLDILEAFSIAKKEISNLKMILIGKGPLENDLKNKIITLGFEKDIKMLKDIKEEELFDYHFSSDLFINASKTNYLYLNVLEAMACGLPVISYEQPYLVKEGINGYHLGINTSKDLAKGIIKLKEKKKRKNMGKESINLSKKWDWKNVVDSAEKAYKKICL